MDITNSPSAICCSCIQTRPNKVQLGTSKWLRVLRTCECAMYIKVYQESQGHRWTLKMNLSSNYVERTVTSSKGMLPQQKTILKPLEVLLETVNSNACLETCKTITDLSTNHFREFIDNHSYVYFSCSQRLQAEQVNKKLFELKKCGI